MSQVLDELDKGQDVHAVDAALKRHEAISADVHAGVSNGFEPQPSVPDFVPQLNWRKIQFWNRKPEFELHEQGHVHLLVTHLTL